MGHTGFKYQIQFNVIYVFFAVINIFTKIFISLFKKKI